MSVDDNDAAVARKFAAGMPRQTQPIGEPIKFDEKRRERMDTDALSKVAERLSCTVKDNGQKIDGTISNIMALLTHHPDWRDVLAFNDRRVTSMIMRKPPFADEYAGSDDDVRFPRPMKDSDAVRLAAWGDRMRLPGTIGGLRAAPIVWAQAAELVAQQKRFDPIATYLDGLRWDEVPRIGLWLHRYFGVDDSKYTRAVGSKWLISGVARTFEPGCKVDHVLVLEGDQGKLKSTSLETLAGGPDHFVDHVPDIENKDAKLQIHGPWIVEFGELDSLSRHDAAKTKAFITTKVDHFRPPYGMRVSPHPRRCIFAGTTNAHAYLKDETGGRRFWPVTTGTIDLVALRRDRDQLWAEAVVLYRAGESWWLDNEETLKMAKQEQQGRYQGDPWDDTIEAFVSAEGRERVTLGHVLSHALNIPVERQTQAEQMRVQRKLTLLGWVRRRVRVDGRATWMYCAPVIPLSDDEVGSWSEVGSHDVDTAPTAPTAPTRLDSDGSIFDPTAPTCTSTKHEGGNSESCFVPAADPTAPTAPTELERVLGDETDGNAKEIMETGGNTGIGGNTPPSPAALPPDADAHVRAHAILTGAKPDLFGLRKALGRQ